MLCPAFQQRGLRNNTLGPVQEKPRFSEKTGKNANPHSKTGRLM
jgi:hypothetical protein